MNIEEELRKAFQAGQRFGAVEFGNADTISGEKPLNEDAYVKGAVQLLLHQRVVELVEGKAPVVTTEGDFVLAQLGTKPVEVPPYED